MGAGNLFIELLGQYVDAEREFLRGSKEGDLSENLDEGVGHHEGGVSSRAENDQ